MKTILLLSLLLCASLSYANVETELLLPADESENSIELFTERQLMGDIGDDGYYVNLIKFESKADPHVEYMFEITSVYPEVNCSFSLYKTMISEHSAYVSFVRKTDANKFEIEFSTYDGREVYTRGYIFNLDTQTCNHEILSFEID